MGALANTRALGDGEFKAAGVTPEPEMLSQVIRSDRYSHVTMFSDGISSVMSDQEVVDLARGCAHPQEAAKKILDFAEQLGVEDNATVLVVPLKGWGKSESRCREPNPIARDRLADQCSYLSL
jgi:protein phosphatase PTC6